MEHQKEKVAQAAFSFCSLHFSLFTLHSSLSLPLCGFFQWKEKREKRKEKRIGSFASQSIVFIEYFRYNIRTGNVRRFLCAVILFCIALLKTYETYGIICRRGGFGMISTRGRYALRMMVDLARHQGEGFVALKDIARRRGIPPGPPKKEPDW